MDDPIQRGISMTYNLLGRTDDAAALLGAMANARRLHILCLLMDGEHSVGSLAEKVSLSQSALSQHLAKLRGLNIVSTRRQGQTIYYSFASAAARELVVKLDGLYNSKH
jgi:DNA-binding transcriptional ArsR family regulator